MHAPVSTINVAFVKMHLNYFLKPLYRFAFIYSCAVYFSPTHVF